jgi:hypothetical protein
MDVPTSELPRYWTLLARHDQLGYQKLRKDLEPTRIRTSRKELGSTFADAIRKIRGYTIRGDGDDWKRCLICGLVWLESTPGTPKAFAISTLQLSKLIGKCKCSINASFQALGYAVVPMSVAHGSSLIKLFPFMRSSSRQMREWTIRSETSDSQGQLGGENGHARDSGGVEPGAVGFGHFGSDSIEPFELEWDMGDYAWGEP